MSGLHIEGLQVARGNRTVLHDVSMEAPEGSITALLGPNGAGKSSLVLALGGLLPVAAGTIDVGGDATHGRPPEAIRARGLAVVPEGRWLLRGLTVGENLSVATYSLSRQARADGIDRVRRLFPELEKLWDRKVSLLSGGEQQMVALGQALTTAPRVLVVDELSLGLAPVVVRRLTPVLQEVASEGVAVLLIEQFAEVALSVSENAYIIEGGRIRFSGTADELRADPDMLGHAYLNTSG